SVQEPRPDARAAGAAWQAGERGRAERLDGVEVLQEPASGEGVPDVPHRQRSRGHGAEPRLQHAVPQRPLQEAYARDRHRSQAADPPGLPEDRRVLRPARTVDHPIQEIVNTFVFPDMITKFCRGMAMEEAIKWGVGEYRRIYSKHKQA